MDDVPIFSGEKKELDSWVTCGHFISAIETLAHNGNFMELEIKELCLSKLSDSAREIFQKNFDKSWSELKHLLFENFPIKLTISEKVEVRKGLQQFDSESVEDFYKRCLQAQYFVSDDIRDVGFEREVLLHFLIGLSPLIRDLVLATKCSSSDDYVNEAKKYVQVIKEEVPDVNVKLEVDQEEYDYKNSIEDFSQYDAHGDYITSELFEDDEIPLKKNGKKQKLKTPKTEIGMGEDRGKRTCNLCGKTFKTAQNLRSHVRNIHSVVNRIACDDCGKSFKNENSLNEHTRRVHSGAQNKWKCEMCHVTFNLKAKDKHSKLIHKQCDNCDKLYVNRYKHYERWHSKGDTCWHCDFKSNDNKSLELHMKENHVNTPKMKQEGWKKCEICNEVIKSQDLLLEHQEKVHGHLKQTCEFCKEVCLTIKNLAMHIAWKHCTVVADKGYLCLYCNSVTKKRASKVGYHILDEHISIVCSVKLDIQYTH